MNWEAKAKLTAETDQLISSLCEPKVTEEIQRFTEAIAELDDLLQEMGLSESTRINAVVGGAARCLLERYGKS